MCVVCWSTLNVSVFTQLAPSSKGHAAVSVCPHCLLPKHNVYPMVDKVLPCVHTCIAGLKYLVMFVSRSVCQSVKAHTAGNLESNNSYTWPWQGFFAHKHLKAVEAVCISSISYLSLWIVLIYFQTVKSLPGYKAAHTCRLRSTMGAVSWRKHTGQVLYQVRQQYIWLVIWWQRW